MLIGQVDTPTSIPEAGSNLGLEVEHRFGNAIDKLWLLGGKIVLKFLFVKILIVRYVTKGIVESFVPKFLFCTVGAADGILNPGCRAVVVQLGGGVEEVRHKDDHEHDVGQEEAQLERTP